MRTHARIIVLLISISLFIPAIFGSVTAGIDKQLPDTIKGGNFTVNFPRFIAVFTSSGNLQCITSVFKQKYRSPLRKKFTSGDKEPLLRLFHEYNTSPFHMSLEQRGDKSEYKVIFTSDTHNIIWRFNAKSYVFGVEAYGSPLSDTLFISGSNTPEKGQQYSSLVIDNHDVNNIEENYPVNPANFEQYWIGIRDRFWTFLVSPETRILSINSEGRKILMHTSDSLSDDTISFNFYAGPITMKDLSEAGRECTYLLYPLWFWMRWLSIGLLILFDFLLFLTGNSVLSIVLLSICVKIIIMPLYSIAVKWQNEVNRQKSILEPRLREINKRYKGEERTNMTLAIHKKLGISPLYALKSLLSAAIQIPIFFAAYHMLSEHIALSGVSFLWISDLAFPDRLLQLPFSVPVFGSYLNIFPFVMTSVSLLSSLFHTDKSLSDQSHKKQQRSLFFMAAVFFLLLYTSPSGMLLYWTMNNILSLFDSLYTIFKKRKKRK